MVAPERGESGGDAEVDRAALLEALVVEIASNLAGPAVIVDESSSSAASAARFAQLVAGVARHDVVVVRAKTPSTSEPD